MLTILDKALEFLEKLEINKKVFCSITLIFFIKDCFMNFLTFRTPLLMALLACPAMQAIDFNGKLAFDSIASFVAYYLVKTGGDRINLSANTNGLLKSCELSRAVGITTFDSLQTDTTKAPLDRTSIVKKFFFALGLEKLKSLPYIREAVQDLNTTCPAGKELTSVATYYAAQYGLSNFGNIRI